MDRAVDARNAGSSSDGAPASSDTPIANTSVVGIQRNLVDARQRRPLGRNDQSQQTPAPTSSPASAAGNREQNALGEQLPDDAPTARTERAPHREFAMPRRRARERQVREVHARDEQQESDGAHEYEQPRANAGDRRSPAATSRSDAGPC